MTVLTRDRRRAAHARPRERRHPRLRRALRWLTWACVVLFLACVIAGAVRG